jgi:hypothetical protein
MSRDPTVIVNESLVAYDQVTGLTRHGAPNYLQIRLCQKDTKPTTIDELTITTEAARELRLYLNNWFEFVEKE